MKNVSMPAEFAEEYAEWCKANAVSADASRNDDLYKAYYNLIQMAQSMFGETNVQFVDPEVRQKSHGITISDTDDIMIEDEDLEVFINSISKAAFIKFGHTGNGTNQLDIVIENIYSE